MGSLQTRVEERQREVRLVDQVDKAGQTILGLLHKAAGVAEANSQHALDMAQEISHQLRAAEDRIAELEAEKAITLLATATRSPLSVRRVKSKGWDINTPLHR